MSQWLVHFHSKGGANLECLFETQRDLEQALQQIVTLQDGPTLPGWYSLPNANHPLVRFYVHDLFGWCAHELTGPTPDERKVKAMEDMAKAHGGGEAWKESG